MSETLEYGDLSPRTHRAALLYTVSIFFSVFGDPRLEQHTPAAGGVCVWGGGRGQGRRKGGGACVGRGGGRSGGRGGIALYALSLSYGSAVGMVLCECKGGGEG